MAGKNPALLRITAKAPSGVLHSCSPVRGCQIACKRDPLSRPRATPWEEGNLGGLARDNRDEHASALSRRREGVARLGVPGMGTGLEVKVLRGARW
jgi:hypothetical protein